jgi:hypothetical protein
MTVALLDACVLYPAALRDLLMRLAVQMAYQPRWTETIHEEWMRNVLRDRPDLTREQLERTRQLMDQIDAESLVDGYEARVQELDLPDADDRHVLAAAMAAGAAVIVTFNLSDFPDATLAPHGIRAQHPDVFLCGLLEQEPERFLEAVRKHRLSLLRPPQTEDGYLETLCRNGLVELPPRLKTLLYDH